MKHYNFNRGGRSFRDRRPVMPEVKHFELSDRHFGLRLGIAAALLIVGVLILVNSFMRLIGADDGWQEISAASGDEMNISSAFTLEYNLGAAGLAAGTEKRELAKLYRDLSVTAYRAFDEQESAGEHAANVWDLNHHVNETLTVEPVLYEALSKLAENESRLLYYGPLYETMDNLFTCETDAQAAEFDPAVNPTVREDFESILCYAGNPADIDLKLLGNNQVCLTVSDSYLAFGNEYGIENYIDFYLMKNAFVTDYIADSLIEEGYHNGILKSEDGYCRFFTEENSFSFTVYDTFVDESGENPLNVETAAELAVSGMDSVLTLKSFPLAGNDAYRYYICDDGSVRSAYLGEDGLCHAAVPSLTAAGKCENVTELLLALLPYYVTDDACALCEGRADLLLSGISTAFCLDNEVYVNMPNAQVTAGTNQEGRTYTIISE